MTASFKLFWFVYWFLFLNCLGHMNIEVVISANFLLTFTVIFLFLKKKVVFNDEQVYIRKIVVENKNLDMFFFELLGLYFGNMKTVIINFIHYVKLSLNVKSEQIINYGIVNLRGLLVKYSKKTNLRNINSLLTNITSSFSYNIMVMNVLFKRYIK